MKDKRADSCDDESSIQSIKPKRLRLIDSDSDRENESDNNRSIDETTPKKRTATSDPSTSQPRKKVKYESNAAMSLEDKLKGMEVQNVQEVEDQSEGIDDEPVLWLHNKLEFLKPKNIKDINGHKLSHPDYDPKTLEVSKTYLDGLTPVSLICNFVR